MTDEKLKATKEYHYGQSVVAKTWNEDKDKLRNDEQIYSKTLDLLQACWKAYKSCIPLMNTKEFWLYPDAKLADSMNSNGTKNMRANKDTLGWIFDVCESINEKSPSYGTICKAMLRFSDVYQYLWKKKYCKLITGDEYHDFYDHKVA